MDDFEEKVRRLLALLDEETRTPWQPWMDGFLDDLERLDGNVTRAAELSPVSRCTIYNHKRTNPEFSAKWDAIVEEAEQSSERRRRGRPPLREPLPT